MAQIDELRRSNEEVTAQLREAKESERHALRTAAKMKEVRFHSPTVSFVPAIVTGLACDLACFLCCHRRPEPPPESQPALQPDC